MVRRETSGPLAGLAAGILALGPTALYGQGVYEPLELKRKEPNDLIGTAVELNEQFVRRSLLLGDPAVTALVERVGRDIAPAPADDYVEYRFFVVRDPSPNAFALPNGDIYVHSGMLARLRDSSQLAALLAHEVNHVAGHHSLVEYRRAPRRILIDIVAGGFASLMAQLRFSRELEQEADDRAPALMLDAGYDPHALPELFELLAEDFEGLRPRVASIWTTHPSPEQRIEASRQAVAGLAPLEREHAAFEDAVLPLRVLTVRDYIQDDYPYTAIALSQALVERYPDALDLHLLLGDAWFALGPRDEFAPDDFTNRDKRRNAMRRVFQTRRERVAASLETEEGRTAYARNLAQARVVYEAILAADPAYAPAYRGLGKVFEAIGEDRESAKAYLEYLKLAPDAVDRSLVIDRLTALRDRIRQQENGDDAA